MYKSYYLTYVRFWSGQISQNVSVSGEGGRLTGTMPHWGLEDAIPCLHVVYLDVYNNGIPVWLYLYYMQIIPQQIISEYLELKFLTQMYFLTFK